MAVCLLFILIFFSFAKCCNFSNTGRFYLSVEVMVWFKNIHVSQCQDSISYQPEQLAEELARYPFKPCSALMPVSAGFVPPIGGEDAPLVHAQQNFMLFCLQAQGKILPPAVLREQHQLKVKALEEKLGQRIARDEKARIKDELEYTLLTQAFHKTWKIYAYLDIKSQQLIVDASSKKSLELFFKWSNPILSRYQVKPYSLKLPSSVLTEWLKTGVYPDSYCILDKATLEDTQEQKGRVSLSRKDLFSKSVNGLLAEGARVTRLGLNWADKVHFTIKEDFSLSALRFLDEVKDLARDSVCESQEERLAADFFIMVETVRPFLQDVLNEFVEVEEKELAEVA